MQKHEKKASLRKCLPSYAAAAVVLILFTLHSGVCEAGNIVVYGDSRSQPDIHKKIIEQILAQQPAAVFHTGDLVEDGSKAEDWKIFNETAATLIAATRFYPALGNHERNSPLFFQNFPYLADRGWYAVDMEGIHFIVLDSKTNFKKGSDQYRWVKSDLRRLRSRKDIKFTVAILHYPPFTRGRHSTQEMELRKELVPLFERHGVNIVFSGHNHNYERSFSNNIYYIVTGGGGAPLYDQVDICLEGQVFKKAYHFCKLTIDGAHLVVDVLDINSKRIDHFRVPGKGGKNG